MKEYLYPTTGDLGWIEKILKNWKSEDKKFLIPFYKFIPHTLPKGKKPYWLYMYYSDSSTFDSSLKRKVLYRVHVIETIFDNLVNADVMYKLCGMPTYHFGNSDDTKVLFICDNIQEINNINGNMLTNKDFLHIDKNKNLLSSVRNSIAPVRRLSRVVEHVHPIFIKKGIFPKKMMVYGKVIKVEITKKECKFIIDIINQDMVLYDEKLFSESLEENSNSKKFKPYFYFLSIKTSDKSLISLLKNRMNEGYFIYELSKKTEDLILGNELLVKGEVLFSASPVTVDSYIVQIKATQAPYNDDNNLPDDAVIKNKTDVERIFKCLLCDINCSNSRDLSYQCHNNTSVSVDEIQVTHVGQGHNSEVRLCNGSKGFYDIGRNCNVKQDNVCDNLKFDFSKYNWVILSHWDMDHYLGVTLGNGSAAASLTWLAPSKFVGSNARRLAWLIYICSGKKPFLIDESITGKIAEKDSIKIIRGSGSSKNDSGLMLFIDQKLRFASLGDVGYRCIQQSLLPFNDPDYLVVSHHGAKIDNSIIFPFHARHNAKAIIPVGAFSKFHPSTSIRTALSNANFGVIHETDKHGTVYCKMNV
jgi:hypothetical protein